MLEDPCLDVWGRLAGFLAHQHALRLRAVSRGKRQAFKPAFHMANRLAQRIQRWWRAQIRAHAWKAWRRTPLHARQREDGCCWCRRALDVPVRFDLRTTFEEEDGASTFVVPHFFCWRCAHHRMQEMHYVVPLHTSIQAISGLMTEDQTQAFVECCWKPSPPLPGHPA